jgi:hypothetical protein
MGGFSSIDIQLIQRKFLRRTTFIIILIFWSIIVVTMGIHGLMKLLSEECPGCVKEQELSNFTGRKVAIDASMAMYQFLIAVRQNGPGGVSSQLTNEAGEVTSHIQGMFNRTIRLMTDGIKPVSCSYICVLSMDIQSAHIIFLYMCVRFMCLTASPLS